MSFIRKFSPIRDVCLGILQGVCLPIGLVIIQADHEGQRDRSSDKREHAMVMLVPLPLG